MLQLLLCRGGLKLVNLRSGLKLVNLHLRMRPGYNKNTDEISKATMCTVQMPGRSYRTHQSRVDGACRRSVHACACSEILRQEKFPLVLEHFSGANLQ